MRPVSRIASVLLVLGSSTALAVLAAGGSYQLRRFAGSAGGGGAAGVSHRQTSLVSQTATGRTASESFILHHGFYGGPGTPLTAAGDPAEDLPREWRLGAACPNPFNPATRIRYELPAGGRVRLLVYDLKGRLVRRLLDEERPAGRHEVTWDGRDDGGAGVASGTYLLTLRAGSHVARQKLTLLR